jgi:hypothetical protein
MTIEDRLRQAIEARTRSVEPSPDALQRITERLDQETLMDCRSFPTRTRWAVAAAAAVVLVVAAIVGGVMLQDGDDAPDRVDVVDRPSTTDPTTPTTTPTPQTTAVTTPPTTGSTGAGSPPAPDAVSDRRSAIWPRPSSSVTFATPEAAARSFARYYAFFVDPVVGTFHAGADSQSGEVPVRAFADGPASRVLVRQLGDGKWYVMGSLAPDITVTSPQAGAAGGLVCPLQTLSGTALAYEGTVQVRIDAFRPDGDHEEIGRGFVTGSGSPPAGPFSGSVDCRYPTNQVEDYVVLTLWTESEAEAPELTGTLQIVTIPLALPS